MYSIKSQVQIQIGIRISPSSSTTISRNTEIWMQQERQSLDDEDRNLSGDSSLQEKTQFSTPRSSPPRYLDKLDEYEESLDLKLSQSISIMENVDSILSEKSRSQLKLEQFQSFIESDLDLAGLPSSFSSSSSSPSTSESSILLNKFSDVTILFLGTSAIATGIGNLLSTYETVQEWRYFWPLLGGLYLWDGLQGNLPLLMSSMDMDIINTNAAPKEGSNQVENIFSVDDNCIPVPTIHIHSNKSPLWLRITSIACGGGLLIGGAYDVFMPVWMTGPNVITNAGIHQDGAMVLFLLTAVNFTATKLKVNNVGNSMSSTDNEDVNVNKDVNRDVSFATDPTRTLLQMSLLAELYKLGESSIDEVASKILGFFM